MPINSFGDSLIKYQRLSDIETLNYYEPQAQDAEKVTLSWYGASF